MHVLRAGALGGGNLLQAGLRHFRQVPVNNSRHQALVDASGAGLQAQTFRQITGSHPHGLKGLHPLQHRLHLGFSCACGPPDLCQGQGQVAPVVNGADDEGGNSQLRVLICPEGDSCLPQQLLLQGQGQRCRRLGPAFQGFREIGRLPAAFVQIASQGGDILYSKGVFLAEGPFLIVYFQCRVFQVFLLNGRTEILSGELEYLDRLLHLHGHSQLLGQLQF